MLFLHFLNLAGRCIPQYCLSKMQTQLIHRGCIFILLWMKRSPAEWQSYWCHCLHCPGYKVAFDNPDRCRDKCELWQLYARVLCQHRPDSNFKIPNLQKMCVLESNPALIKVHSHGNSRLTAESHIYLAFLLQVGILTLVYLTTCVDVG